MGQRWYTVLLSDAGIIHVHIGISDSMALEQIDTDILSEKRRVTHLRVYGWGQNDPASRSARVNVIPNLWKAFE
jgi:hypothetical protein